jgi:hypothetical protein
MFSAHFVGYSVQFFLFPRFLVTVTTGTWFEGHRINSLFSCFCPFSHAMGHSFLFPEQFLGIMTIETWFEWRHKKIIFFMFLPILMGHSAHFSVPGMISSCHDNRYMV